MVKIITCKDNIEFFFKCVNILMYDDDYSDNKYSGNYYRNKSETLIFNGYQIKSFEKVFCKKNEDDGYMIVSTYESLKEMYKTNINHHTKKHIKDLIKVINFNTSRYGMLYSDKEIQEMNLKTKENVEIIKSKWLKIHTYCSIENIKETCCIDLEEYDTIVKTDCGHFFSVENLYEWIRNNQKDSCPLCRKIIAYY